MFSQTSGDRYKHGPVRCFAGDDVGPTAFAKVYPVSKAYEHANWADRYLGTGSGDGFVIPSPVRDKPMSHAQAVISR